MRLISLSIVLIAGLMVATAQQPASNVAPDSSSAVHTAVVNQYCLSCHNSKLKVGGLALDAINSESVSQHPQEWEKVVRKLRGQYMPPPGLPRPDDRTYKAIVSSLMKELDSAAAAKPNPGRTGAVRRLTRTEYQNAIRDLLAIRVFFKRVGCRMRAG